MSARTDTIWRSPIAAPPRRRAAIAVGAGLLALAYLLPFRAYGLNVEDEGTLLYQILRVTRGELPYVDFSTGYTPGFFALNALLWSSAGDLVTFRMLLALLHAGTVAALAALLAGVARPVLALLLPVLYLAYIPLFPGEFCAFNVAYPAWFATAGWLATVGAMLAFTARHRRSWLVAAGVAAAVTLAMKPNAGVFAFAAAAASVLATERRGAPAGWLSALCWTAVFVGILLGVVVVFGIVPRPLDVLVYLAPLVLAMATLVSRARFRRPALIADLLALGLPFAALSAPWLIFFWSRLGTNGFLREVLLIGSGAADLYYVPFPALEPWGLLLTILTGAFAAAALLSRRWVVPRLAVATIAVGIVAAVVAVLRRGLMPEGVLWSMIWQLQSAAFALTLSAQLAGIAWLWRHRVRSKADASGSIPAVPIVLVLFAIFMHFQLYPRADFMHLLIAAPLSLVLAGFLLENVLGVWEIALIAHGAVRTFRAVEIGMVAVLVTAVGVGLLPGAQALIAGPRFTLPFAVAPVGVEQGRAGDLRDLATTGERVARAGGHGAPGLGFPSIGVVLFLTGGRNPSPHDYFYAGRPDHREEAEILDAVAVTSPRVLTALNRQFTFFDAAQAYYFLLRRFVRTHYGLVERNGRFDVLERGVSSNAPEALAVAGSLEDAFERLRTAPDLTARLAAVTALAAYPAQATAATLLALATSDEVRLRRAALEALLSAITRAPEHGLETYVAASKIDRRGQILLLRTIRDLRDGRAASYLFTVAASDDRRLVVDALGAMKVTRASLIARRYLWAGTERPMIWPARGALLSAIEATLAAESAPPEATALAAHVAGALADAGSVQYLRARLQAGLPGSAMLSLGDAATAASAADALAALASNGLACDLTRLLVRSDAPIQELVPTRLLDLAEAREPVRSETRRCLRDAIVEGRVREPAIWIAAALGDGFFGKALRDTLASPRPEDRRAAAWALGELPSDVETAAVLAERVKSDPDEIVRRLASSAYGKQTGQQPRTLPRSGFAGFPDPVAPGYKTAPLGNDPGEAKGPA